MFNFFSKYDEYYSTYVRYFSLIDPSCIVSKTGSRFLGNHEESSDYDFIIYSPSFYNLGLEELGFVSCCNLENDPAYLHADLNKFLIVRNSENVNLIITNTFDTYLMWIQCNSYAIYLANILTRDNRKAAIKTLYQIFINENPVLGKSNE